MIKTRTILIGLLLGVGICLPQAMKAQVAIGSSTEPKPFSLLELTSNTKGLRMPQLTTEERDAVDMGTYATSEAKGLMIFNTDTKCMEYWNGSNWVNTCGEPSPPAPLNVMISPNYNTYEDASDDLFTGAVLIGGTGDDYTRGTNVLYTNVDAGVFKYTGGEGQFLPELKFETLSGLTVVIPAQTLAGSKGSPASGYIDIKVSGIPIEELAGKAFNLPINLLGHNLYVRVNVGCGAYIGDKYSFDSGIASEWLQFQCYNLGASNTIDPFTPNQYLHGAKYRFGTEEASLTMAEDQDSANDTGVTGWSSKPVQNDNYAWSLDNNPCPENWDMPFPSLWQEAIVNNTLTRTNADTWTTGATNYSSGIHIGDALFLPAAGERHSTGGALDYRGLWGEYWTSEVGDPASFGKSFYFDNLIYKFQDSGRPYGFSMRCVRRIITGT